MDHPRDVDVPSPRGLEATQAERVAQASVVGSHLGMKGEKGGGCLEDHPRTRKDTWLGSPPFKNAMKFGHLEGEHNTTRASGDKN